MPVHVQAECRTPRVPVRALASHVRACLKQLGRPRAVVSITLVDDEAIAELNEEWRGVAGLTDVLSFAMEEGEPMPGAEDELGDIVISVPTAARQAEAMVAMLRSRGDASDYGVFEEVAFLATHGLLHLLGHDHQEAEQAERMEAMERALIADIVRAPVHELDRTDHAV